MYPSSAPVALLRHPSRIDPGGRLRSAATDITRSDQSQRSLAVADPAALRPGAGLAERHPVDLDHLRLLVGRCRRLDAGGEEEMQYLGEYSGRAEIGAEALPFARAHACLLDELPLRGDERRLVRFQLSRRQFPQPAIRDIAILLQQANTLLRIDRDCRRAAGMMNNL